MPTCVEHPGLDAMDIGFTLATARAVFDHRATIIAADRASALNALNALATGQTHPDVIPTPTVGVGGKIAFMCSGQGTQRPGMAAGLYHAYPAFATALDEACAHLNPHLDPHLNRPLRDLLLNNDDTPLTNDSTPLGDDDGTPLTDSPPANGTPLGDDDGTPLADGT